MREATGVTVTTTFLCEEELALLGRHFCPFVVVLRVACCVCVYMCKG